MPSNSSSLAGPAIDAETAHRIGLVSQVVPADEISAATEAEARRFATIPANQLALNKLLINQAYENMGMRTSQMLGTFFDGITRHTEEAYRWTEDIAERGFKPSSPTAMAPGRTTANARTTPDPQASSGYRLGVLERDPVPDTLRQRVMTGTKRAAGDLVHLGWDAVRELGAIGPDTRRGRRFGKLGRKQRDLLPAEHAVQTSRYIHIGTGTLFGRADHALRRHGPRSGNDHRPGHLQSGTGVIGSAKGVASSATCRSPSGTTCGPGHHVYITDQNHGYDDLDLPISRQVMPERPVSIGDGAWLGHGTVVLPGATIGRHVVVGANSVVIGELPDNCVAAGVPAKVIKQL